MVSLSPIGPFGKKTRNRAKGSKAQGLAYERKFGKRLRARQARFGFPGEIFSGQWFRFKDAGGFGFAQPDFYILRADHIILFECKLTGKDEAWRQLRDLYSPLLEEFYSRPVICVQVCKNIRPESRPVDLVQTWAEVADGCTFHWINQ